MKPLFQYISAAFFCITVFSCSNSFLNEESDLSTNTEEGIFLSPQWGAADYSVRVPTAGNAKFSVTKVPDWLKVNTSTGQFNNDVAIINCSASLRSDFSAIGFYYASMILDIEGIGKCLVPVTYISEGNPGIETETDITLEYNYYGSGGYAPLNIKNTGEGILLWGIMEKPEWITIHLPGGTAFPDHTLYPLPQQSGITLDLLYSGASLPTEGDLQGKIVIASNDKNHSETTVNVSFSLGTPSLNCYTDRLDFGRTETVQAMEIFNQGAGLLVWNVESLPEWLSVSDSVGVLSPYSWKTLTFTCNRSLMPDGQQSQTIYLKTNDKNNPSYAITVTAVHYISNPENIRAIEGIVTDARLDKTGGILYLTTSQPNRLLAYNTKTKTIDRELALSKAPTCFSLSEDGHQALIGHSGLISCVDMNVFSVTKTLDVNYDIFDIEWGADNWCCYAPGQEVQHYVLQWKNLDTGETYDTPYSYGYLYGKTLIKKMPNKDYIVASRLIISPSGITVFNIQDRSQAQYFHQDIGNFWFSFDGNYLFSSWSEIYRTSSLLIPSSDLIVSPIAAFSPSPPYPIYWIDHQAASRSVWVLSTSNDYYGSSQREIRQYEDNDFTYVKTYYYEESYKGYPAQAQYVFAIGDGSGLAVIKNNSANDWAIEHITVTK